MEIKPLNDWIVIQTVEAEAKTPGGIIIPEVAKEKPQWGIVVSAGPGAYRKEKEKKEDKKFVPTEVKAGDKVLYERYMASEFELEGRKIIMVREANILGKFDSDEKSASKEVNKKASATAGKPEKTAAAKKPKTKK
jgi:chaperonin GroES